jgi:hypothetical protein
MTAVDTVLDWQTPQSALLVRRGMFVEEGKSESLCKIS